MSKLPELTDYELEQNAQKQCVLADRYVKREHKLQPEELRRGFGLHTISSLEIAIRKARTAKHVCLCEPCIDDVIERGGGEVEGETFKDTSTLQSSPSFFTAEVQERLKYLMGLPSGAEEAEAEEASVGEEAVDETVVDGGVVAEDTLINGGSEAMRRAQRYLRNHRIFEFFQFLIAHLLSALPFDPVEYLINLCDKLLIYRSGICDPPLLFEKKHIECLFNLMDRMRTGVIDYNQYTTGMQTLGVKSYNANPPMSADGLITKCYFVEEAHECLTDLLDDIIRRRCRETPKKKAKVPRAPPPSMALSVCPSAVSGVDMSIM